MNQKKGISWFWFKVICMDKVATSSRISMCLISCDQWSNSSSQLVGDWWRSRPWTEEAFPFRSNGECHVGYFLQKHHQINTVVKSVSMGGREIPLGRHCHLRSSFDLIRWHWAFKRYLRKAPCILHTVLSTCLWMYVCMYYPGTGRCTKHNKAHYTTIVHSTNQCSNCILKTRLVHHQLTHDFTLKVYIWAGCG